MLAVSVLSVAVFAADPSPKLKAAIDAGEKYRVSRVEFFDRVADEKRATLQSAKKGKIGRDPGAQMHTVDGTHIRTDAKGHRWYSFDTAAKKKKFVADTESEILSAETSSKEWTETKNVVPRVDVQTIKVGDVGIIAYLHDPISVQIDQVIDGRSMLVSYGRTAFILNDKTTGLVDGKRLTLSTPFEVTGTQTYTTVTGGSKTVMVLTPFAWPTE
jgi:hypothetical protein